MKQLAVVALLTFASTAAAQSSDEVQRAALAHMRKGRVAQAVQTLRDRIALTPTDVGSRTLLGKIYVWDGRPDDAIAVWEGGITDAAKPVELFLAIGGTRLRQAKDGPNMVRKRGTTRFSPSKDKAKDEAWKAARARDAVGILKAGLEAHPKEKRLIDGLSKAYIAAGDKAAAITFLEARAKQYKDASLALRLAELLSGEPEKAVGWYRRAVELDPRNGMAHAGLSIYHRKRGETKEADAAEQRSVFFAWMPPFAKVAFSPERFKQVKVLRGRASDEQVALVKTLGASSKRDDLELLAALVYSHPHNHVETLAFELLGKQKAAGSLLVDLFDRGESQCTKRGAAQAMAAAKAPGAYERLIRALPGDMRSTWNMNIAGALAVLGDPRAVPHLVRLLEPSRREAKPKGFSFSSRKLARRRAALALGAFNIAASERALMAGASNPDIDLECWAAYYRLLPTPERLAGIKAASAKRRAPYQVADYLAKHGDDAAKALAKELRAAIEAKRKKRR